MTRHIGLLAPEVCSRGGVQSFMLRMNGVIGGLVKGSEAAVGYCISLNDSSEALRRHPAMPSHVHVWGANRSKLKFITHALLTSPPTDLLFVGHIGLAPVARVLKMMGRVRAYYVIVHGVEAWRRVPFTERSALRGAKGIVATTRYTADQCARLNHLPGNRFRVIPLCSNERSLNPTPGFRLNGDFKLLCVARQDASERHKGFEQLFHALALLKASHPAIHLNLVGHGDDQDRLRAVANESAVGRQVTFWGELSDEDLAAAYEHCDVFAMPSKQEGFGIVFLEAMLRGKPCIGGNHGGTPDVIEHGGSGFLVQYGDAGALAKHIRTLADNASLRHAMGARGQELVKAKFSFKNFQTEYQNLVQ